MVQMCFVCEGRKMNQCIWYLYMFTKDPREHKYHTKYSQHFPPVLLHFLIAGVKKMSSSDVFLHRILECVSEEECSFTPQKPWNCWNGSYDQLVTQGRTFTCPWKGFGHLATVLRLNKCVCVYIYKYSTHRYISVIEINTAVFAQYRNCLCSPGAGFCSWSSLLFFFSPGRWSHSQRENLQTVYKKATRCREAQDPPGQRAQVHVDVPASAHLLLPLQRVHLVRMVMGTCPCCPHLVCMGRLMEAPVFPLCPQGCVWKAGLPVPGWVDVLMHRK